jgi:hypothetical protein
VLACGADRATNITSHGFLRPFGCPPKSPRRRLALHRFDAGSRIRPVTFTFSYLSWLGDCTPEHRPSSTDPPAAVGCLGSCPSGTTQGSGAMTGGSELGVPNKSLSKTLAFYSLTNLHMPNWNTNNVVIYAPIEEVKAYIVQTNNDPEGFMFNMHLLFPERYPASDPA